MLAVSFMTTQAMLRSQDTLYLAGDLDLLLTAPLSPRRVLLAKLCGIVANIVMVFAAFTLPVALPVALLGHPGLFGIPLLLLALAMVSACLGLAITLAVVRIASPRTARTIAQIVGAFLGAGVFLASQFLSAGPGRESAGRALVGWLIDHDFGSPASPPCPGRAAFGELPAMVAVLGAAMLVFLGAGALLGRVFLISYQNAPARLTRSRGRAKGGIARHFREGLFATMFAKEARLLRRDPQLAFTIVLRLIYLVPIALPAFTHGRGPPLLPALAFAGVLIAGQLAGSLAWLTVSAEDSPDLIAVAPVEKQAAERAKLAAALLIAAPFALVLPVAIALLSLRAAVIALADDRRLGAGRRAGRAEIPAPGAAAKLRQSPPRLLPGRPADLPDDRSAGARRRLPGVAGGLNRGRGQAVMVRLPGGALPGDHADEIALRRVHVGEVHAPAVEAPAPEEDLARNVVGARIVGIGIHAEREIADARRDSRRRPRRGLWCGRHARGGGPVLDQTTRLGMLSLLPVKK